MPVEIKRLLLIVLIIISSRSAYPVNYYVNDALGGGELWCTAAGNDANNGTAINTPKATVGDILVDYNIQAGDIIYIDKGSYTESIVVSSGDGDGSVGNYITFQGAGTANTTITGTASSFAINIQSSCNYVKVIDMTLICTGGNHTCIIDNTTTFINFTNCTINLTGASTANAAIQFTGINNSTDANYTVYKCTISSTSMGIRMLNCATNNIARNTITNTSGDANAIGLYIYNVGTSTITNNKIYNSHASSGEQGIALMNATTSCIIRNNYSTNYRNGIYVDHNGACQTNTVDFNSIYATQHGIEGWMNAFTAVRSNIFYTSSSSATDFCFNQCCNSGAVPAIIDYNLYYHPNGAKAANINVATYANLSDFVSGTAFEDAGIEADPLYTDVATGNLDLSLITSPAVDNAFDNAVVVNDVRYAIRTATNQDIGAYEFGATLPVELLSFTATSANDRVILQWVTASEINNDYFVLERSEDAINFHPIGTVDGAGNSTQLLNYSFNDYEISTKNMYYRLKQVDYDGTFSYSRIIAIQSHSSSFSVYPAFVDQGNFELMIHHEKMDGPVHIRLYAYTGALIASEKKHPDSSDYIYRPGKIIAPGYYILKITTFEESFQEKIVVY